MRPLGTEGAFAVLARARALEAAGRDIVHLEIGQPDFDTPPHVKTAAEEALAAGLTGYCPAAGMPELRAAAAEHLSATRGIDVVPEAVLVAPGAKPFLFFTVLATCDPGDEVVMPDPAFPIYASAVRFAGAIPRGFRDPDELADALSARTRLVMLNSPSNPTGAVMSAAEVAAAAEAIAPTDAWVLSDEVYRRFLYDGEFASIAALPGMLERTVLLDSCSKTYAMTGWRCGYAAVPEPLRDPLERFFVNAFSCVPPFVQLAAVAALTGPDGFVREMVAEFAARREIVVAGLNALPGVTCAAPGGAFYAFPEVDGADTLAERLLDEAGVALLPGSDFGAAGAGHLRLSFAASRERLREGLARIDAFLRELY
ncbi:MAG TPA: pyridoxal phosphate-dependent aminotransferase [Solirubrobacteraceae bacterium]